jgi:hypothetical protein
MEPVLVVAAEQVVGRVHALDGMAKLVDVVMAAAKRTDEEREDAALPFVLEDGLRRRRVDGAVAMHSTEIVNAVHLMLPLLEKGLPRIEEHRRRSWSRA